ncbi:hypothetical protein AAFF_G00213190 [Aldrovandia affinis]|uniref:RAP domain-containing protein n=1 Tax=Aldrovandia affinis TaxID=143900 RepID=A0AAD7RH42_9TELE|nr:hypothetical protein AAFF_G00213190 [Aldrovandia affinis]
MHTAALQGQFAMETPRCRGNSVRYYTQDGPGWQGQHGSKGQSLGSQYLDDAADPSSSLPEESALTVPCAQTEKQVPFYAQLKECHSPTDVLDLVGRYTLTVGRVSNSLTRIWMTTKKMSEEQKRYERRLMFEHPVFRQLCDCAMVSASRMRSNDAVFSLLAVVKLGLPQTSRVVQTLLRAVQESLNEFDERSLSVLASCLDSMESSQNVDALRDGLRLVVEDRVPGIQSVMALQSLMRCVGRDAPMALKWKLEKKALAMVEQFSLPNAQYMLTTLAAMNLYSKPLLSICSKNIAENIYGIPTFRLLNVLKACRELRYRDLHLLSALAEYLTSTFDIWDNKQLVLFLLLFKDLGFRPVELLDKFLEKVIQNPSALTQKDVLSLLKISSQLNHVSPCHQQEFLESVTHGFESYLPKMAPADLLRGVFFLCILGHFPLAPLQRLLRRDILDELLAPGGQFLTANQRKLHYVGLCLRLDRPPLPQALAVPDDIAYPPHTGHLVNQGLVKMIQSIVGAGVLEEGVVLENTYFIDCLITLPLQRTDESSPSEGEPCRRVAVLWAPSWFFCLGTPHPQGRLAVMIRHLKALGYRPVVVPEHEFEPLSEEERVETLRELISAAAGGEGPL